MVCRNPVRAVNYLFSRSHERDDYFNGIFDLCGGLPSAPKFDVRHSEANGTHALESIRKIRFLISDLEYRYDSDDRFLRDHDPRLKAAGIASWRYALTLGTNKATQTRLEGIKDRASEIALTLQAPKSRTRRLVVRFLLECRPVVVNGRVGLTLGFFDESPVKGHAPGGSAKALRNR